MKKIYRFTYQEAIHALEQLHPELVPAWIPKSQRPSDYVEVGFEIEPRVIEEPKERQIVHLDGPITTYVEPRPTHHDDGHPI